MQRRLQLLQLGRRLDLPAVRAGHVEDVDHLIQVITRELKQPLRPCHPRDIINQVCWGARYEKRTPRLDRDAVDQACRAYFISPR